MLERNARRTALGTAQLRAVHQFLETQPLILEDPVALRLLGGNAEASLRDSSARFQAPGQRLLRSSVVLRSRYAEDRLRESLDRGVKQYVILGAGFDTFALRQPEWARGLRIIEVDHEATQLQKRQMILAAQLNVPSNVLFATVDFERETLLDALKRHAVDVEVPTFFAWLGVTMYLQETAIDATLRAVGTFPIGSEIVLTYAPPRSDYQSPFEERAAELGEPWVSFFTSEQMGKKLLDAGFTHTEFLSSNDAYERYFRHRPQDLEVPRRPNLVSAVRA